MAELKENYERFLAEEAAIRIPNVNLGDRGWFHLCVLQGAVAWSRHPRASFRVGRGKHVFLLHFEGPVEGKPVVMFSFRSAVETGEYRFTSLNPAKLPQGLTPAARRFISKLTSKPRRRPEKFKPLSLSCPLGRPQRLVAA